MPETLITLVILIALFAWSPLLQAICPACSRLLKRYRHRLVPRQMSSRDEELT